MFHHLPQTHTILHLSQINSVVLPIHIFSWRPGGAARSAAEHEWPDQSVGAGPSRHLFVAEPQDAGGAPGRCMARGE